MGNYLIRLTTESAARLMLLIVLGSLCTFCTKDGSSNLKEIEETLRKADASIQDAMNRKDIDLLLSFYADDASMLPACFRLQSR